MNRSSRLVLALFALLSGCNSNSTGADTRRYACTQDDECVAGFVCRANTCQAPGTPPPLEDDGGGPDTDAGVPDGGDPASMKLSFITAAQTVTAGQCSSATTLESQTAAGSAAPGDRTVTVALGVQPSSGATFYQDAACTSPLTSTTVAAGSSRATFYFKATASPSVSLSATAPGFIAAQQSETVRAGALMSGVFITDAQTLPLSGCSARVELELRDAFGNPTVSSTPRSVTFTGSGTGLSFYSDAACTTAITDAPFTANASRTSFYFKGKTSGTAVRLRANVSGLGSVDQDEVILPMVRAGVCQLPENSTSVTCLLSPAQVDLSKTMLFFQASPSGSSPNTGLVRCFMSAKGAFTCGRNTSGSAVSIFWKTVEMASGLKVQHLQPTCSSSATTLGVNIDSVSTGNTFLLVSSENDRSELDDNDFFTAKLTSSNRVEIQFSTGCSIAWKGSLQVVQLEGARVVRGSGALATNQYAGTNAGLPSADPSTTAMLYTYRVSRANLASVCDRALRGQVDSPTEVTFSRADGSFNSACAAASIDEIAWERINFGALAQVQPLIVSMSASTLNGNLNSAIDLTRTVAFSSGQALNGQSGGTSTYSGDDLIGESLAGIAFNTSAQISFARASARGTMKINTFVVQFEP